LRDVPSRLHLLRLHPELAARRAPVVAPEADRVGGDERRLGITGRGAEVVEPQLGDVDHDALVRAAGQHPLGRHHDVRADRRHPRIDARVGVDDLVVAEVEPACDVEQRVALPDAVVADGADHRVGPGAHAVGRDRLPREGRLVPRRRRVLRTDARAQPPLSSRMAAAGSPWVAFTVATAPSSFAKASFSSATSTAMTQAPRAVAICTAESPTPPQPCTATHSPAPTFAWSTTPWKAVM